MKVLLSEQDVYQFYGISVPKLQRDRLLGVGLPYIKVGRSVRYHRNDIEAWLASQRRGGDLVPVNAGTNRAEAA